MAYYQQPYYCAKCKKDFRTRTGLKEHYVQSPRHHVCQLCSLMYSSEEDLEEHIESDHWFCESCSIIFKTETGLHEHNRQKHWYCVPCRRVFQSESNLDHHLNSSTHKPKNFCCPGANCPKAFVSMSAMLLHFEAGTCPSGMTRSALNRMVVRGDRNNVITNPARLLRGPDGYAPATVTETWATERSWNGYAYECFLCYGAFRSLQALNAHLKSPRHQEKIYRCPNRTTCGAEYSALSALTQHVENGNCGVRRFKEVQNALDSIISGMKRIAM